MSSRESKVMYRPPNDLGLLRGFADLQTARIRGRGMQAELVVDAPGKTYPQHAHEETLLVGLFGWAAIRLENEEWRILHPRDDLLIRSGVVHEAVVGDNGWGYLAGTFKRRS